MTPLEIMFDLLRCELCGGEIQKDIPDELSPEMLQEIYRESSRHDMAHLVGHTMGRLGLLGEDPISQKFRHQAIQAFHRYSRMDAEFRRICGVLEQAQIAYLPLKGSVLRAYYPEPWMRTSCDIDILVSEDNLDTAVEAIVNALGYVNKGKDYHDISLFSPNGIHLELHFDLIEAGLASDECRAVLGRIWEDARQVTETGYRHSISDAFFYFFHVAHMAKHFVTGGCGIRPFLDLWILNHNFAFDVQKRTELLEKAGLLPFAEAAKDLSEFWFSKTEPDHLTLALSMYTLSGGVYGTAENKAAIQQSLNGSKFRYLYTRVFAPYDAMKARYPILREHGFLLPVYHVVRWVRLLQKGKLTRAVGELRASAAVSDEECMTVSELRSRLGLK